MKLQKDKFRLEFGKEIAVELYKGMEQKATYNIRHVYPIRKYKRAHNKKKALVKAYQVSFLILPSH